MILRRQALAMMAAASVLPAERPSAQTFRKPRSVVLVAPDAQQLLKLDVFRAALRDRGHGEGVNLVVRSADGNAQHLPALVAEVAAAAPAVIVAINSPTVQAALAAPTGAPVVMAFVGDRVGAGVARVDPGRDVTGVTNMAGALAAKRLALLKEAKPEIARVLALHHPDDPIVPGQIADLRAAALSSGVDLRFAPVAEPADVDAAFASVSDWRTDAVFRLIGQTARTTPRMIDLARRHRLPTMAATQLDVAGGALMAYYASIEEHWERVAALVDRILRGTSARDLPIEQPTRFELVINLATARAIGLTLPPAFVARADEVIE